MMVTLRRTFLLLRVSGIGEKKEGFSVERTGDKRATTENVQRS
jgi:hypothetical protein